MPNTPKRLIAAGRHAGRGVWAAPLRRRMGAWLGLALLALDLFLGVALPLAAAQPGLIPAADYAICSIDGFGPPPADEGSAPHKGVFCAACLPLVHLLQMPAGAVLSTPAADIAMQAPRPPQARPHTRSIRPFRARAPPLFV